MKAWTASLAKRERSSEEPVQEPLMSGEKAPHPVRTPGLNQQDTRRPAKRNSWSPAGFMNLFISATAIGILIALFSASGIFGQLQEALNTILSVKAKPDQGIWGFIRARFLSFLMVGGICFLLLVSLTVENLLKALHGYLRSIIPGGHYLALAIFYVFDLGIIILLFAMLFRYLPDAKIAWRDVWMGASLTAVLFVLGKFLLGLYLGSGAAGSAYGAASSLVTLLLWIFYSTQILLFGAEFTKVYTTTYGSRIEREPHA